MNSSGSDGPPTPTPDPPPTPVPGNHSVRPIIVIGCLIAILVVVGAVLVSRPSDSAATMPSSPDVEPVRTFDASSCPGLGTAADVRMGDPTAPVSLTTGSFVLDRDASPPTIRPAGQLHGTVPSGGRLWVVDNPRPDSFDSTPDRNPGNDRFYPVGEIATDDGCWSLPANSIGYDEAVGIDFDYLVVLVDDTTADDFRRYLSAASGDGYTREEFDLRATTLVATFTVAT